MEDLDTRQKQQLERREAPAYDQMDQGFHEQARTGRKRLRQLKDNAAADASEESEANEMFQLELEDAFDKYGQKRKKKHTFNDAG